MEIAKQYYQGEAEPWVCAASDRSVTRTANLRSGSNQGPWSLEAEMLAFALPICLNLIMPN